MAPIFPKLALLAIGIFGPCASLLRAESPRLRDDHSAPMIIVRFSESAFSSLAERQVEHESVVDDNILGTAVHGTAHVIGGSKVVFMEDRKAARFQIECSGVVNSRTVGVNGPVVIYSRSQTSFRATKHVTFVPGEGFLAAPTAVAATTRSITDDIRSNRAGIIGRVTRRRAWQRVAESRPITNQIIRHKTAHRIGTLLDNRLNQRLADLNRRMAIQQILALAPRDKGAPVVSCCTQADCVQVCLGRHGQESAVPNVMQITGPTAPIEVWIRSSLMGGELTRPLLSIIRKRNNVERLVAVSKGLFPATQLSDGIAAFTFAGPQVAIKECSDWMVVQIHSNQHLDRSSMADRQTNAE